MLEGKPLFPGKDHVNQFSIITELLGTPPDDVIETIGSENTLRFVRSLPRREKIPFSQRFKNADPLGIPLEFVNPSHRLVGEDVSVQS